MSKLNQMGEHPGLCDGQTVMMHENRVGRFMKAKILVTAIFAFTEEGTSSNSKSASCAWTKE